MEKCWKKGKGKENIGESNISNSKSRDKMQEKRRSF